MEGRKRAREYQGSDSSDQEVSFSDVQTDSDTGSYETADSSAFVRVESPECSSGPSPSSRRERRAKTKEFYLKGKSRKAYRPSKELQGSLEDENLPGSSNPAMASHFEPSEWNDKVCRSCAPVLIKYSATFKGMKRQGTELKRRKSINPHPKRPATEQYRDLVKQNEWLRNNVFDSLGNYLFCSRCIHYALGVSYQRLSRQRSVKKRENSEPLRSMTKSEVEKQNLGDKVVMPPNCELSYIAWWKQLPSTTLVNVRYPHHRNGNAGKASHAAKKDAKSDFLTFVDANSQPSGRSADSSSATHFFLPKFRTIQTPKKGVANYQERLLQSLVGVFNQTQNERQRDTISNYSASTWLKKERPKHSIYPHKLDYCDYCAKKKEMLRRNQTTLNRIRQTRSASEEEQRKIEGEIFSLTSELKFHLENARKSHDYYIETTGRCKKDFNDIQLLEANQDKTEQEKDTLKMLKHN